jgi:hypothetical protein
MAYAVSRKWQFSTSAVSVNNRIFTGKVSNPTTQNILRNRGQPVFFDAYVYTARGSLVGSISTKFNTRPTGSEASDDVDVSFTLASGRLNGASATYDVDTNEPIGGKTLVVWSGAVSGLSATNQPRTGVAGNGNFAESDASTAEWTVSATYTVNCRTQKESARNADPEDTQFTIGEDVIYFFNEVLDATGDPVDAVTVNMTQINPSSATTASQSQVTASNGLTPDPGAVFDSRAPKGAGWIMRSTVSHNGNTDTCDVAISMVSAFTANKNISIGFGPVTGVSNTLGYPVVPSAGNHARPGDRFLLGLTYFIDGQRTAPDPSPVPTFMMARFNLALAKAEILQADGTWKNRDEVGFTEHFFDFKVGLEPTGGNPTVYVANFGTAGQGVTTGNGYVFDTGLWGAFHLFVVVGLSYQTQTFRDDDWFPIVASSAQHPYSIGKFSFESFALNGAP